MEAMMQTDATSRETHNLIASDRVEGTPVRSTDGTTIGTIERVMIDKLTGDVAYAVLSFNGFMGTGQRRLPIPWPQLTYDRKLGAYHLDLIEREIKGALSHGSPESGGSLDLKCCLIEPTLDAICQLGIGPRKNAIVVPRRR